eukprot:13618808-Alexandrium_andersonii.AAC.1
MSGRAPQARSSTRARKVTRPTWPRTQSPVRRHRSTSRRGCQAAIQRCFSTLDRSATWPGT